MKQLLTFLLLVSLTAGAQCDSLYFSLATTNPTCAGNDGIITVVDLHGTAPFVTTGAGNNLSAGPHIVSVKDACGTVRTRQATLAPFQWDFQWSWGFRKCNWYTFQIYVDSTKVCNPTYGWQYRSVVYSGSTAINWVTSDTFSVPRVIGEAYFLYVKNCCGQIISHVEYQHNEVFGYINHLDQEIRCYDQDIYPVYYGFDQPTVCCYRYPQNTLVACKQAPAGYTGGALTNFFHLPFGQDYYIIVQDPCYRDSAFFKDKTSAGGSELNPFAWHCNTFDLHSDGNNSGTVCIYNSVTNAIVACKPSLAPGQGGINPQTGQPWENGGAEFYDLPYGDYYSYIFDPCTDSLYKIDSVVSYHDTFSAPMIGDCRTEMNRIQTNFSLESQGPYHVIIYNPDSTVAANVITNDRQNVIEFPALPIAGDFTVVASDSCGHEHNLIVHQDMKYPVRSFTITGGCPGVSGNSGSAIMVLHGDAVNYTYQGLARVHIISKDGVPDTIGYSYTQWSQPTQDFIFNNLSSGTYIVEQSLGCASFRAYDTITIAPYGYPFQTPLNVVQCGSNPYVFKDSVSYGIAPFSYHVLATNPVSSLVGISQYSSVFQIPPGTNLNTITIEVVDACANSQIKTFPVTHLSSCIPLSLGGGNGTAPVEDKALKVYPNPSRGSFTISISQKKKQDYKVTITDTNGIEVFTTVLHGVDRMDYKIQNVFAPGLYFIRIESNSGTTIRKQLIF